MATFVLVHGAWDGGWGWRKVARRLQASGHEVFTPTLTGSGERVHLASPDIGLDTYVLDIVNVFRYEELHDAVLVGSSFGGMVITGVAEVIPERISHLIYLDAFVPQDGESASDIVSPELMAVFTEAAQVYGDGWRVPSSSPQVDRRTDFLLKAGVQPLRVNNPAAAKLPHTYVLYTDKSPDWPLAPIFQRVATRVRAEGWNYRELAVDHWAKFENPDEVAQLLLELL